MAKISTYPTATPALSDRVIGTDDGQFDATKNFTFEGVRDFISAQHADPANIPLATNSAGVAGQIAVDANYLYVCVSTNNWKRVAISGWI